VRQRNDTGYEQNIPRTEMYPDLEPRTVGVGEEIDYPTLIGGFTPVPENESPEEAEPSKSKRKIAAVAADKKEGEPQ
jgi:hypothetical protein